MASADQQPGIHRQLRGLCATQLGRHGRGRQDFDRRLQALAFDPGVVRQRCLGQQLRRLRDAAGACQKADGERQFHVARIELSGQQGLRAGLIVALQDAVCARQSRMQSRLLQRRPALHPVEQRLAHGDRRGAVGGLEQVQAHFGIVCKALCQIGFAGGPRFCRGLCAGGFCGGYCSLRRAGAGGRVADRVRFAYAIHADIAAARQGQRGVVGMRALRGIVGGQGTQVGVAITRIHVCPDLLR